MNPRARLAAARLTEHLGEHLVSVIYYPEPFYRGGIVAVFADDTNSLVDLISKAFECVPLDLFLHCLRRAELFELCLPAFTWLHVLNRHIQLAHNVKHKGVVLYGEDVRTELPSLPEPRVLLDLHLESGAHFMRNHGVLRLLAAGEYLELIKRIDWQIKSFISSALLVRGEWDGAFDSIRMRFETAFNDPQLGDLMAELDTLKSSIDPTDETSCRRAAFEAVWLFECFQRALRRCTQ